MSRIGKSTIGVRGPEGRARPTERHHRAADPPDEAQQGQGFSHHGDALGELRRGLATAVMRPLFHTVPLESRIA